MKYRFNVGWDFYIPPNDEINEMDGQWGQETFGEPLDTEEDALQLLLVKIREIMSEEPNADKEHFFIERQKTFEIGGYYFWEDDDEYNGGFATKRITDFPHIKLDNHYGSPSEETGGH